jgi:hypothetical protein
LPCSANPLIPLAKELPAGAQWNRDRDPLAPRTGDSSPENGNLAPDKTTCEPPADCINCHRHGFFENFNCYEGDVEELESRLEAEREANAENEEAEQKDEAAPQSPLPPDA